MIVPSFESVRRSSFTTHRHKLRSWMCRHECGSRHRVLVRQGFAWSIGKASSLNVLYFLSLCILLLTSADEATAQDHSPAREQWISEGLWLSSGWIDDCPFFESAKRMSSAGPAPKWLQLVTRKHLFASHRPVSRQLIQVPQGDRPPVHSDGAIRDAWRSHVDFIERRPYSKYTGLFRQEVISGRTVNAYRNTADSLRPDIERQIIGALAGGALGTLGVAGLSAGTGSVGWEIWAAGLVIGYPVGVAAGVFFADRGSAPPGSPWMALAGAAVGAVPGILLALPTRGFSFVISVPLGSMAVYNGMRRQPVSTNSSSSSDHEGYAPWVKFGPVHQH